jgi:RNA polymerase sigma-70 factor, ECF subfamily
MSITAATVRGTAMQTTDQPLAGEGWGRGARVLDRQKLDEALLRSIAAGDKGAMQVLFQRHSVRVYRFALRFVEDAALAEDIASEVFVEVWRHARGFKARSQVTTWLLAIARHKASSALRRRSAARLDDQMAAEVIDPGDNPEAVMQRRDRGEIVRRCLAQLSPIHREILDLVYYHEKSIDEVAQIVGAPKNTIKSRMIRARGRMAELLAASRTEVL